MFRENHPILLFKFWLRQYGLPALLALTVSSCGNDLSDLNALAEQSIRENAVSIEVAAQLSADQVVSPVPITSDSEGGAQFIVNLTSNAMSGMVTLREGQTTLVQQVQIRKGFAGRNGNVVLDLSPDSTDPTIWRVPDNQLLSNTDVELLLRGGLHVLVTTTTHSGGELRGQLLLGGQELLINPLNVGQLVNDDNSANRSASAVSYLSVDFVTGEVQGSVRQFVDVVPTQVTLHGGLAGREGQAILHYEADVIDAGVWNVPENTVFSAESLQQLEAAQLYVQASNADYPAGAIRGQLYLPYYVVLVSELSGLNLIPQIDSQASGKAFFTLNAFDGVAQAIVQVSGMSPANVILFRANNPNSTENGQLLYTLETREGYWQLPPGTVFGNNNFNDIGNSRLMFIATSQSYPLGEIGGRI
ncbi:CHRD domain-containing protein [Kaarinaea lacus]